MHTSVVTFTIVLALAVAVLGAPSNSTSGNSASTKRPSAPSHPSVAGSGHAGNSTSHSSFFIKGAVSSTKAPFVASGIKKSNSNSTRVTRDLGAVDSHKDVSGGHSDSAKFVPTTQNKNANSTRVTRDTDEVHIDESDSRSDTLKTPSNSSSSSQHFVPSTHPLFANRHSSNITNSLKPKIRGSGSPAGGSSDSSEEDKPSGTHLKGQSTHSTHSSEERISVVSSGPVSVQSKNSTRPIGIGSRRASSSTHAPIEDEELAVFVF